MCIYIKRGEDQNTKTSSIDDVNLQVCHVKFFLMCPMHFTVYLLAAEDL